MSKQRPTVLITGASYGVGAATAKAMAIAGFDVAVSATRLENLASVIAAVESAGARAVPMVLDLRARDNIAANFDAIAAQLGGIDVLVNNAAANLRKKAVDVTAAEWDAVMVTNLTGTFFITQQMGRHLIAAGRPGAIINISSTHGIVGAPERSTYGISKAGLIQMTRMLAIEWAPHNIRVNAIAPGRMETNSPSRAANGGNPEYMKAMLSRIPLGRLATAEEVAAAACYLASPQAVSVTGQTLVLDGGLTTA